MKCKYCKSKKLDYDGSTNMYFCNKCKRLLTPEEAGEVDLLSVEETSSATEAVPIEEEDLGTMTLILLGLLGSLPIFDIVSTSMIEWSTAKDEYKRTICARLISRIFLIMLIAVIVFIICGAYNIELKLNVHDNIMAVMESSRKMFDKDGVDIDLKSKSLSEIEFKYTYVPVEIEEDFVLNVKWDYLDKSIITGGTFMKLLEDCSNGNLAYLVQTKNIVEKFDKTTYRSLGVIVTDATREGQNDNWYYNGSVTKEFSLMTDDYDEYISDSMDDLSNKKFIFYIDSASVFRLNILRNEDSSIIGFAITEVALDTSEE